MIIDGIIAHFAFCHFSDRVLVAAPGFTPGDNPELLPCLLLSFEKGNNGVR